MRVIEELLKGCRVPRISSDDIGAACVNRMVRSEEGALSEGRRNAAVSQLVSGSEIRYRIMIPQVTVPV